MLKEFKFLGKAVGRVCFCNLMGIGQGRLKKALCMMPMPDLRIGQDKSHSRSGTHSVDAFLSILYEGVAETLPDREVDLFSSALLLRRFVRRGRSQWGDDPEWDVPSDEEASEELKGFLDNPGKGLLWQSFAHDEDKKITKYSDPGTVIDLYTHYSATRRMLGAEEVSQLTSNVARRTLRYSTFLRVYKQRWEAVLKFRSHNLPLILQKG